MGELGSDGDAIETGDEHADMSRRGFLVGAAGLTGVAMSGVWRGTPARAADASSSATPPPTGYVFLELNGRLVGTVQSFEGAQPFGEVAEDPPDPSGEQKKHVANIKWSPGRAAAGMGMGKGLYDWIKASMSPKAPPMNGAVILTDPQLNQRRRTDFQNALITEIGFPACDAASKDPAFMSVTFAPQFTATKILTGPIAGRPSNQKLWSPANFRFTIDGLDASAVSRVEAFSITQTEASPGTPAHLEFPNLLLTLPEGKAKGFFDWFDDFLLNGNNSDDAERAGALEWLSPDLSHVLSRVSFDHLGIIRMEPAAPDPVAGIRRFIVEMYCERMEFDFKPST
jgi:hypothetical protein